VEDRPERTICLEELRRRIARLEEGRKSAQNPHVATGCDALDRLLPKGGFRRGALVEWLSAGEGVGVGTLALLAARTACQLSEGDSPIFAAESRNGNTTSSAPRKLGQSPVFSQPRGVLAILDPHREFCPIAAVRLGIGPEQLLVVQPQSTADNDWAIDQVLRSPAVAAVVAWPKTVDGRTFRRWQLAAEQGGSLGLLLRPATACSEPSWADVRLLVEPLGDLVGGDFNARRLLRITLLRCRGGSDHRSVDVELDDETYLVHPLERRQLQIAN
jgi:protein ImuA